MDGQSSSALTLAVVIPVFNEEANIAVVTAEWMAALDRNVGPGYEILLLNDGSTDGTAAVLDRIASEAGDRVRVVHKGNSGHGRTCRAGYELALASGAEWVLQIDSDGQCDPVFFEKVWAARAEGNCVFGERVRRDDGQGRVMVSTFCRWAVRLRTGMALRDPNVPYRLIHAPILSRALNRVPPEVDLQNVAIAVAIARDPEARCRYIPIHFRARQGGINSLNYQRIIKLGLHLLRDLSYVKS
jgi:dolichol-phosphate mannosyltransferase